jgi:type I restriction-modification system DNA methylase subunit
MREKTSDEYYTTSDIIKLPAVQEHLIKNINDNFIDTNCGTGNWLVEVLERKLEAGIDHKTALEQIYGVELFEDSAEECRQRLLKGNEEYRNIVNKNIVTHSALEYDYSFNGTNKTDQELLFDDLFE